MINPKRFRFRQFPVYVDARRFNQRIKKLSENFPSTERFLLTAQLHRALDSIVLNIAEGSDRSTDKDFAHFLNTSHGSINEVVACMDVAADSWYITEDELDIALLESGLLANQLTALRKKLLVKA